MQNDRSTISAHLLAAAAGVLFLFFPNAGASPRAPADVFGRPAAAGQRRPAPFTRKANSLPVLMKAVLITPAAQAPMGREESNDLGAFRTSLSVAGVPCAEVPAGQLTSQGLSGYDIIVVPFITAKTLKPSEKELLLAAVNAGSHVILDGPSALAAGIGIELEDEPVDVEQVRDLQFPGIPLHWGQPHPVYPIQKPRSKQYTALCVDKRTKAWIAARGTSGKGSFIYFSPLFDPDTDKGYSRFPFLIETMSSVFGYTPVAERDIAALYFDPGSRDFADPEPLVRSWREHGVHTIHAGGWYADRFDYGRLIRLCHENGILVYCWLELPMAGKKVWDRHPEWREKTALRKDAHVDWRYLMNLADPACRIAVFSDISKLLFMYDWDGVNLAEFYFESTDGVKAPERFTPMNTVVRREFLDLYGFDPLEIFDPKSAHFWNTSPDSLRQLIDYRKTLCNRLKNEALRFLSAIQMKKTDFEIVVTAIDAFMYPHLEETNAEDSSYLIELQHTFGFTLQMQDEWMFWPGKPERYAALGAYYRKYITETPRLELDFNVVESHPEGEGGLPAEKPTGEEIRQVVYNIGLARARPAFYAEDTVYAHDFRNINTVLAREALVTQGPNDQWETESPYMVSLRTGDTGRELLLDGKRWHAGDGDRVIVPAGTHTVRFLPGPAVVERPAPRLSYISGELGEAAFSDDALEFSYTADNAACYAVISSTSSMSRPGSIAVDGKPSACPLLTTPRSFSIKLPRGTHNVTITTNGVH
jgi:hypothetical protein